MLAYKTQCISQCIIFFLDLLYFCIYFYKHYNTSIAWLRDLESLNTLNFSRSWGPADIAGPNPKAALGDCGAIYLRQVASEVSISQSDLCLRFHPGGHRVMRLFQFEKALLLIWQNLNCGRQTSKAASMLTPTCRFTNDPAVCMCWTSFQPIWATLYR